MGVRGTMPNTREATTKFQCQRFCQPLIWSLGVAKNQKSPAQATPSIRCEAKSSIEEC